MTTGNSGVETDRGSNDDRETAGVMVPAGMKTSMRFKRWIEQGGKLLRGMLDDITLNHINTKLSWRDVHVLSSVSPGWQKVLQSREIYDRRVDSYSTETFAVIPYIIYENPKNYIENSVSFALYSVRDDYSYELPPFPFGEGLQLGSKSLSLDRKVYVVGGRTSEIRWDAKTRSPNVFVLDLIEKEWEQCANTSEPRQVVFAAAALDRKIYVFGGGGFCCPTSACEVYDEKFDAWSLIKPLPLCRIFHKVAVVGDELFVYGGRFYPDVTQPIDPNNMREDSVLAKLDNVTFLDVYHPVKDEWRRIIPSEVRNWDTVFTTRGNFHQMTPDGIEVYDLEQDLWSLLHTFHDAPDGFMKIFQMHGQILPLGDELLFDDWKSHPDRRERDCYHSKGFGSKNRTITWKEVNLLVFFPPHIRFLSSCEQIQGTKIHGLVSIFFP